MLPDRMIPFWDSKTNEISLNKAFPKSTKPAHWVDPVCGHRWVQRIGTLSTMFERMDSGLRDSVCPACEGNVLIPGQNDLATTHPELISLWNPNNMLKITDVSKGSAKIVSWICPEGHGWSSKIKDQANRGSSCRTCKSTFSSPKEDKIRKSQPRPLLKDTHPELFKELCRLVENDKPLHKVTRASSMVGEWMCSEGHIYEARISNRSLLSRGCPFCAGRYSIPGENDITVTDPDVMEFWDYEANVVLPETIKRASSKPVHWVCEKKHKWTATPAVLTLTRQFCPYCSGKKIIAGETDFASKYPQKLSMWNYEKNAVLPHEVSAANRMAINWKCSEGHEWESSVYIVAYAQEGGGCAICSGRKVLTGFNDLATRFPHLLEEWNYDKNDKQPSDCSWGSGYMAWWKCSKNHEWQTTISHRTGRGTNGCPECACGINVSKAERIISDWVTELLPDELVMTNTRKIVKGFEMDIYIPSKNIGIEYNGVYWHSEAGGKDKSYHHDKWKACKDKGIQLIQIWEDEWNRNPKQIKRMLAHKLGISNERKVFARKTAVVELTKLEVEPFLNENHVQGYASGSYYLGLKDKSNDEIVSVLVLKKEAGTEGKTLNIIRYATNANVGGGFTKLLKHAAKQYQPESFITFSDHCVSDGGLYENNGFIADKELPPDYMYVVGNVRKHKFGYRINKFKTDPKLLWEEGLTERQLAELNGLKRIWDAGKTRWVLTVSKDNT